MFAVVTIDPLEAAAVEILLVQGRRIAIEAVEIAGQALHAAVTGGGPPQSGIDDRTKFD